MLAFDYLVILITMISFILCLRSLWQGHRLCQEVRQYYAKARKQEARLKWTELQVFYSFWYFIMILTDCLLFTASIIKLEILYKVNRENPFSFFSIEIFWFRHRIITMELDYYLVSVISLLGLVSYVICHSFASIM